MCKVKIVDSIPGSGKTSAIINKINESSKEDKYIYITPFLTEVERVKKSCKNKKFKEPKFNKYGNKFDNLNKLIGEGKNVVSTHSLFHKANMGTVELIQSKDYILVLDEVFSVVKLLQDEIGENVSMQDIDMLISEGYAYIENGFLLWNEEKEYSGKFENIQYLAMNRSILIYGDKIFIWTFPVEIFKAFKEVYILTYMFEAQEQCYYYNMHNVKYEYLYATKENDTYILKNKDNTYSEREIKDKLKRLITIIDDEKINLIGSKNFDLSHGWYRNECNKELIKQLKNNVVNFFINKTKSKSNELLWTTYKDQKDKLKGKGYTKGFISINIRATNDYSNRFNLAYLVNIFTKPIISNFFVSKGVTVNQDLYALSELIQWIWRSRVRKGEPINLFIPSKRMRNLLIDWLNN
ncbi:hypothetical protein QTH47_13285 [Clostridium perfringens]|uniref:hypothetical protein n=1 Tax=Clostridium perfringens TaxID=1502 RepID=UPI0013E40716|nr:hypothetical protein [Clostridium perfringens]MDM0660092.1 hypothetical protein [Clostridium perfringens]NGS95881.1 hypothetical protein [Clostridium perfringens]